jgi:hypothetical protein
MTVERFIKENDRFSSQPLEFIKMKALLWYEIQSVNLQNVKWEKKQ